MGQTGSLNVKWKVNSNGDKDQASNPPDPPKTTIDLEVSPVDNIDFDCSKKSGESANVNFNISTVSISSDPEDDVIGKALDLSSETVVSVQYPDCCIDFNCPDKNAEGENVILNITSSSVSNSGDNIEKALDLTTANVNTMQNFINTDTTSTTRNNIKGQKFNIKILSWTVESIIKFAESRGFDYLQHEDADIIALQETNCAEAELPKEANLNGYFRYYSDSQPAGCDGVILYTKKEPISVSYSNECTFYYYKAQNMYGRIIVAEYKKYYVVNINMPSTGESLDTIEYYLECKKSFQNYVLELNTKKRVIICGNLGVDDEKVEKTCIDMVMDLSGRTDMEHQFLQHLLSIGFIDTYRFLYPELVNASTYRPDTEKMNIQCNNKRLNYFLISKQLRVDVCDIIVIRDTIPRMHHCPIILYANFEPMRIFLKTPRGKIPFQFGYYNTLSTSLPQYLKYIFDIENNKSISLTSNGKELKWCTDKDSYYGDEYQRPTFVQFTEGCEFEVDFNFLSTI